MGDKLARYYARQLRYRAKRKGIEFSIPFNELKELITQPCIYCGATNTCSIQVSDRKDAPKIPHNSIDRIDNTLGYIPGNVVTCCKRCNQAKSHFTVWEFIWQAHKISSHMSNMNMLWLVQRGPKDFLNALKKAYVAGLKTTK